MRKLLFASFAALAALVAVHPAQAQGADSYAFCYADPPTYRSGTLVYTQVRFVGAGAIDIPEVGNALAETSQQVKGRQPSCWRYPNEQIAEAKRQEGMARDRSRGYTVIESGWQPSRISNVPVPLPVAPPVAAPVATPGAPTITATPVPDAAPQPAAALPPVSAPAPAPAAGVVADINRALDAQQAAPAAPPAPPEPDPQAATVANLNAGVAAAEAARLNAAAQVQADYQRQLAEHQRQVEAIRAANAKAQADYQAAVKACAAGDLSKCGGPPVPVKRD